MTAQMRKRQCRSVRCSGLLYDDITADGYRMTVGNSACKIKVLCGPPALTSRQGNQRSRYYRSLNGWKKISEGSLSTGHRLMPMCHWRRSWRGLSCGQCQWDCTRSMRLRVRDSP